MNKRDRSILIAAIVFAIVFGASGQWIAGLFCFAHFVLILMPKKWQE